MFSDLVRVVKATSLHLAPPRILRPDFGRVKTFYRFFRASEGRKETDAPGSAWSRKSQVSI